MQATQDRGLHVLFDVHQYRLAQAEENTLRNHLEGLAPQVENFPHADLHVLIEGNARSNDVSVKLALVLPGNTLVTSDHDIGPQPALERCLDSLVESLNSYKDKLGQVSQRQKTDKGTVRELHTPVLLDSPALAWAVEAGDYCAFRGATLPLEEPLRKRVGRRVQRFPEFEGRIGNGVEIADIVEDVFLMAFEQYPDRPTDVPFGDWLESLIDPAIRAIERRGDEELESIHFAQAACALDRGMAL